MSRPALLILLVASAVGSISSANARELDICDKEYLLPPKRPDPSDPLSVDQINDILVAHNTARRKVYPHAKRMPMLQWSPKLAAYAQKYVGQCPGLIISPYDARMNQTEFGVWYVGESMAAGPAATFGIQNGNPGHINAVNQFVNEGNWWTFPQTCDPGHECKRYTQVIWADTTQVGCGWASCSSTPTGPGGVYWSCNYAVGGNMRGGAQLEVGFPPYEIAQSDAEADQCTYDFGPINSTTAVPTCPTCPCPTCPPLPTSCMFNICDLFQGAAPATPLVASAVMTVFGLAAVVAQLLA